MLIAHLAEELEDLELWWNPNKLFQWPMYNSSIVNPHSSHDCTGVMTQNSWKDVRRWMPAFHISVV